MPRPGKPLTVSIVAPSDGPSVWIRLAGDVDIVAEPALAEILGRLDGLAPRRVVIDVAAVTFAGATLVHFLDALHGAHPYAAVELHHSSSVVRLIVKVTGLDQFVVISDDPRLPAPLQPATAQGAASDTSLRSTPRRLKR